MKYIQYTESGWDHSKYWEYLPSAKNFFPSHIYKFAIDYNNHDLRGRDSLHDSNIEIWKILEYPDITKPKKRKISIEACFRGPYRDRNIYIAYKDVKSYSMTTNPEYDHPPYSGHGDLLVHELIFLRDGIFSHELIFSRGTVYSVQFTEFEHRIETHLPVSE